MPDYDETLKLEVKPRSALRDFAQRRLVLCCTAGKDASPWHGISLRAGGSLFSFVCEIPKETVLKMEVNTVLSSPLAAQIVEPVAFIQIQNKRGLGG